jgi:serine protease inhibitor
VKSSNGFKVERPLSQSYQYNKNNIQSAYNQHVIKKESNVNNQPIISSGSVYEPPGGQAFFLQNNYPCYTDYLKSMVKYFNLDNPAPYVTARSWCITNLDTGELLFAKQEKH